MSKYNYFHTDTRGDVLMCNFVRGKKSFLKIRNEDRDKIGRLQNAVDTDCLLASSPVFHLIEKGYYINADQDELLNIRTLYYDNTMSPLLSLTIMPTEQCNFRCRYCYEKFERGRMTESAQKSLLLFIQKKIPENTHIHISWFGGEPLLAFDVIENIMRNVRQMCYAKGRSFTSNMTTNAYLLTQDKFEQLYNLGIHAYQITLDGLREDHNSQRCLSNGDGTFDRIVENLLYIKQAKSCRFATITIRINITANNVDHLNEFLNFYTDLFGDDKRFNIRFSMTGDYGGDMVENFKPNLLDGEAIRTALQKTGVYNNSTTRISDIQENFEPMNKVCYTSGRNTYTIGSDLSVYRCTIYFDNPNNILGHIDKHGDMAINRQLNNRWYIKNDESLKQCIDCFYFPCCYRTYCPLKLNFINDFDCEIDTIKKQLGKDMEYLDTFGFFPVLEIS